MNDPRPKAAPPEPHDFLAVDADLSDTERDIRDTVRAFSKCALQPNVADWFEAGILSDPRGLAKAFGDLEVLGMHLESYSCGGSIAVSYWLACRELEAVDSGLRRFVTLQGS